MKMKIFICMMFGWKTNGTINGNVVKTDLTVIPFIYRGISEEEAKAQLMISADRILKSKPEYENVTAEVVEIDKEELFELLNGKRQLVSSADNSIDDSIFDEDLLT